MSNVSAVVLPMIIPFFGAAVVISCGFTCCLWRRNSRNYAFVMDRVTALETRYLQATQAPQATIQPAIMPVYNVQYGMPPTYRPSIVPYYQPGPSATAPPMDPRSVNL